MKTKRLAAILAAGVLFLLLTGCTAQPESDAAGEEQAQQTAADTTPQTDLVAESAASNETAVEPEEEYTVLTSEQVGAVLRVPADYADGAMTESDFALYIPTSDQTIDFDSAVYFFFDTSQAAYARDGLVWAITACSIEALDNVLKADQEYSDLCFDLNCHILGVDSESVYMLANINPASSAVRQFDSDSEESVSSYYAHAEAGMEILEDFVAANQLTVPDGAVDWKMWYDQWMLEPIMQQLAEETLSDAAQLDFDPTKVITNEEFVLSNGVSLGMRYDEVIETLGGVVAPAAPEGEYPYFWDDGINYSFSRDEDGVYRLTSMQISEDNTDVFAMRGWHTGMPIEEVFATIPARDTQLKQWALQELYNDGENYADLQFVALSYYSMSVRTDQYMVGIMFSRVGTKAKNITLSILW